MLFRSVSQYPCRQLLFEYVLLPLFPHPKSLSSQERRRPPEPTRKSQRRVDIIFERTSQLNVKDCAEFCTWCIAFGDEHNVKFKQREI